MRRGNHLKEGINKRISTDWREKKLREENKKLFQGWVIGVEKKFSDGKYSKKKEREGMRKRKIRINRNDRSGNNEMKWIKLKIFDNKKIECENFTQNYSLRARSPSK